jgi:hypothetical protein
MTGDQVNSVEIVVLILLVSAVVGSVGVAHLNPDRAVVTNVSASDEVFEYTDESTERLVDAFEFSPEKNGRTVRLTRVDATPSPMSELVIDDVWVIGNTLVVKETFVRQQSADRTAVIAPTVVSPDGYSEALTVDAPITQVAVFHPYNNHPYVRTV